MRKFIFKLAYIFRLYNFIPLNKKAPTIICMHRVTHERAPGYPPNTPDEIDKILKHLKKHCEIIDFDDWVEHDKSKPACIITFDDAYYDFKEYALPIIKKHDIPVTLNVISHCAETGEPPWTQKINDLMEVFAEKKIMPKTALNLNLNPQWGAEKMALAFYEALKTQSLSSINTTIKELEAQLPENTSNYTKMLTWREIKTLISEYPKLYIGNHTKHHRNLFKSVDVDVMNEDIMDAKNEIKKYLDIETNRFAFPNGQADENSIEYVKKAGYKFIQLTNHSYHLNQSSIFFRIPPNCNSFEENIFKIHGFHDRIKKIV
jgi:peptidoglycan/xylan/chitin deacetylase (PgdA/CDA1 family)